ncbi:helix-turn-helix domain-containing protein [Pseudomonas knackmussii]|uniref:helix-turn-helix domain-containing protein n=1 Tax=Pseudomonas knackmussii TaxID=65741 RepID=UPI003F4A3A20
MNLGARLKAERERLQLSQTDFAAIVGASKHAQINWEKGAATPNAAALEVWAGRGLDVLYVVTGQRSNGASTHHLTESGTSVTPALIDADRLGRIVELLEAFARNAGKCWPSAQLVTVAAEVYNVLVDEPALDESKVERILKLVVNR